mgnify:CR=1 FL=1
MIVGGSCSEIKLQIEEKIRILVPSKIPVFSPRMSSERHSDNSMSKEGVYALEVGDGSAMLSPLSEARLYRPQRHALCLADLA